MANFLLKNTSKIFFLNHMHALSRCQLVLPDFFPSFLCSSQDQEGQVPEHDEGETKEEAQGSSYLGQEGGEGVD